MNERRIARIQQQIKARIATLLQHEIADPRLGFVTVSRVEVDKEMQRCVIYWSVLGSDSSRQLTEAALNNATGYLRREVAAVLHTRSVPKLEFRHDESVVGSIEMQNLLEGLRQEREDREGPDAGDEAGDEAGEAPPTDRDSTPS